MDGRRPRRTAAFNLPRVSDDPELDAGRGSTRRSGGVTYVLFHASTMIDNHYRD